MSDTNLAPPDYSNPLPEAIRRQAQRVDEIARAAGLANVPGVEGAPDPASAPSPELVVADPAPAPTPPPTENWEQRYRTLQGKYDTELPNLRAQVDGLQRVLATMNDRPPPAAAPAPPPTKSTTVVDPADVETFGEDLVTAARRWARAEIAPELAAMRTQLDELKTGQQRVSHDTAAIRTQAGLDGDPEIGHKWRVTNADPAFLAWLNEVDPFAGQQRSALIRHAYAAGDVQRTARFFRAFYEQTGGNQPPGGPTSQTPTPPVQPAAGAGGPTLESLVAPGRGSAAPLTAGAPDRRIWTQPDIARFYGDVRKGAYQTREAERLRVEEDIIAAAREGRIR